MTSVGLEVHQGIRTFRPRVESQNVTTYVIEDWVWWTSNRFEGTDSRVRRYSDGSEVYCRRSSLQGVGRCEDWVVDVKSSNVVENSELLDHLTGYVKTFRHIGTNVQIIWFFLCLFLVGFLIHVSHSRPSQRPKIQERDVSILRSGKVVEIHIVYVFYSNLSLRISSK